MDFRDETQDWDDEDWDILDTMYHKHEFHLVPSRWADYQKLATLSWQTVRFDETNSTQIPTSSGIYAFCVEPHITDSLGACFVMYFGQANNLKR